MSFATMPYYKKNEKGVILRLSKYVGKGLYIMHYRQRIVHDTLRAYFESLSMTPFFVTSPLEFAGFYYAE